MSEPRASPDAEELTLTGWVAGWSAARDRLATVEDPATRALLAAALDQVERVWPAVVGLMSWVRQNREDERREDDYGCLLTYVEAELGEAFRSAAHTLGEVVANWPSWERASVDDVDGWASAFLRYATVLLLASESGGIPAQFRELVRKLGPFRLGAPWAAHLRETLQAISDRSQGEVSAGNARDALGVLLHDLPEHERDAASRSIIDGVKRSYLAAEQAPPEWVELLTRYFQG